MLHRTVLLILLFPLTGCYKYTSVEIHVFDAQTNRPLEHIKFEPDYPHFLDPFSPKSDPAVSNAEGIAVAKVCTDYKMGFAELVMATDGYSLDQPVLACVVNLPIKRLRENGSEPFHVDVGLLTLEEFRRRYPYP